ncbi:MAG: tetratricopeptide repeat protein [Nitrospinota bacterium]
MDSKNKTIAIVEDSFTLQAKLTEKFRKAKINAQSVEYDKSVITKLTKLNPRIIITDRDSRKTNPFALIKAIRESKALKSAEIFFLGSSISVKDELTLRNLKINSFFIKSKLINPIIRSVQLHLNPVKEETLAEWEARVQNEKYAEMLKAYSNQAKLLADLGLLQQAPATAQAGSSPQVAPATVTAQADSPSPAVAPNTATAQAAPSPAVAPATATAQAGPSPAVIPATATAQADSPSGLDLSSFVAKSADTDSMLDDIFGDSSSLSPADQLKAGLDSLKHGKIDEAIASLSQATDDQRSGAQAKLLLGMAYRKKGDIRTAINMFQDAMKSATGQVKIDCHYELAVTLERINKQDQALKLYRAILELSSNYRDVKAKVAKLQG